MRVRQSGDLGFDRDRNVALDLLGGQSGALHDHIHERRHGIGIGFDIQDAECRDTADERHHE